MLTVFLAVMSVHLDAQVSREIHAAFLTQGFVLESLSGLGFTGSNITTISNISSCNPASLLEQEKGLPGTPLPRSRCFRA